LSIDMGDHRCAAWAHPGKSPRLNQGMATPASQDDRRLGGLTFIVAITGMAFRGAAAQAAEPIKIGMSMVLRGSLAATGKAALLATQFNAPGRRVIIFPSPKSGEFQYPFSEIRC
jgi:hypothetical protein